MGSSTAEIYFNELQALYQDLGNALEERAGNPCGTCNLCCTTEELDQHNVTALELDFLESQVGSEKTDRFLLFMARDPEQTVCPHYENGCTVYEHRPYSCRIFGHYRRQGTALPEVCVFKGQEEIFSRQNYAQKVPEADNLTQLSRRYWPYRMRRREVQASTLFQAAGVDPTLAQALELVAREEHESAVELALSEEVSDPFSQYCQALILEQAGRPDLACSVLIDALHDTPKSADLWYRLGSAFLVMGRLENSQRAFSRATTFDSRFAQAWGMLGLCLYQNGQREKAQDAIEKAVELEGQDGRFSHYLHLF